MLNSYLDEFNGRLAASRQAEMVMASGLIKLVFDARAPSLLRVEVYEAANDGEAVTATVKLTAIQLRRLIAELQAKLGVLTAET